MKNESCFNKSPFQKRTWILLGNLDNFAQKLTTFTELEPQKKPKKGKLAKLIKKNI